MERSRQPLPDRTIDPVIDPVIDPQPPRASHARRLPALALTALLALAAAGCGTETKEATFEEDPAAASSGPASDVGAGASGVPVALPDDFPEQVTVIGTPTFANKATTSAGDPGWTVTTSVDAAPADAFGQATDALTKEGFTLGNLSQGTYANASGNGFDVVLTAAEADGGASLTYAVSPTN